MDQIQLNSIANQCVKKIIDTKTNGSYFDQPFQYLVIDNFLPAQLAKLSMESFPHHSDPTWVHSRDQGVEVKARSAWQSEFDIPSNIIDVIRIANSSLILKAMSDVLNIPKLMPDPYFSGGGLNISQTGGHLDIHIDGNYHDASGLNRRVNLLIYFNPNWKKEWGGELGIYSNNGQDLINSIAPLFNRCVIFDSHDKSYHGLPNPIHFPPDDPRRSIILYYYTQAKRPIDQIEIHEPHSALWKSKNFTDKKGNKTRDHD